MARSQAVIAAHLIGTAAANAAACNRALASEKQQKMTRLTTGAAFSTSAVAATATLAARAAGKSYTPVDIAGKATDFRWCVWHNSITRT